MSSFTSRRSVIPNANSGMTKANTAAAAAAAAALSPPPSSDPSLDNSVKNDRKKKSILPKIFGSKRSGRGSDEDEFKADIDRITQFPDLEKMVDSKRKAFSYAPSPVMRKSYSGETSPAIEGLNLSNFEHRMAPTTEIQSLRVFVATWNVGGKTPNQGLNLEDFLLVEGSADIYVLGFQEIVPLSAGNVLVIEDNEPAAKWLSLINQSLNKPKNNVCSSDSFADSRTSTQSNSKDTKSLHFFQKSSLKELSRNYRADSSLLKSCNCALDSPSREQGRRLRKRNDLLNKLDPPLYRDPSMDQFHSIAEIPPPPKETKYCLISSKQMVGIFLSIWTRKDLVPHIAHLRVDSVGRGIMGCLGNKGCLSVSMSLHQTTFCFVCSHLASGEKEGDELRRNSDVAEILKSTQFSRIGKNPCRRAPEKIVDHDRIIWLGDLNYRISLSYDETRFLLEDNDWDALLEKDQLNTERDAGRVFKGFDEGRIMFAPTYKYSHNSDSYAGETVKSKKKRRTPAWCDRILWRGKGIEQLSYIRGESRFSDHRPVCAVFAVEVEARTRNNVVMNRFRKGYSYAFPRFEYDDTYCIPQRHSFYD